MEKTNSLWYKVKLNSGEIGYGSSDFINFHEKCGIVVTETTPLTIRDNPSKNAAKIGEAFKNSALTILEESGNSWAKVKLNNGTTGYAYLDYIEIQ